MKVQSLFSLLVLGAVGIALVANHKRSSSREQVWATEWSTAGGLNGGAIVYHRGRGTVYQGGGRELAAG